MEQKPVVGNLLAEILKGSSLAQLLEYINKCIGILLVGLIDCKLPDFHVVSIAIDGQWQRALSLEWNKAVVTVTAVV